MGESRSISSSDAAILAVIAENPAMPGDELAELVEELTDEQVASIARALVGDESVTDEAAKITARRLLDWVRSNRLHSTTGKVSHP